MKTNKSINRRGFIGGLGIASSALILPSSCIAQSSAGTVDENINHIGPKAGFTPQIGTLVSMLDWLSNSVVSYNSRLSTSDLDFIFDDDSNSIGSLMMHLAATEVVYQDITFHGLDDFSEANKAKWSVAMNLGETARKELKGNPLSFYKDAFAEVREETKAQMKLKDDEWLLSGETKDWDWNNYCKWFHVAEHYANHRGQMTWYAKRIKS